MKLARRSEDYGGQEKYGYSLGYLEGMKDYPFLIWRFVIGIEDYYPATDLSFCPIPGYENLRLVAQEAKSDEKQNLILRVERRYETLPGPLLTKLDFDNNEAAYPIVTTTQRIALPEYDSGVNGFDYCPIAGYTNLVLAEQHLVPSEFGVVRDDQRIYEINPSSVVTTYDYDSTIDAVVQTRKQKVIAGTVPVIENPLVLEYREKPVDRYRTVTVASKLLKLPPTRVEFRTSNNWPFPTLVNRNRDREDGAGYQPKRGRLVSEYLETRPERPGDSADDDDVSRQVPSAGDDFRSSHQRRCLLRDLVYDLDYECPERQDYPWGRFCERHQIRKPLRERYLRRDQSFSDRLLCGCRAVSNRGVRYQFVERKNLGKNRH